MSLIDARPGKEAGAGTADLVDLECIVLDRLARNEERIAEAEAAVARFVADAAHRLEAIYEALVELRGGVA